MRQTTHAAHPGGGFDLEDELRHHARLRRLMSREEPASLEIAEPQPPAERVQPKLAPSCG
jgi:hypothetical protein